MRRALGADEVAAVAGGLHGGGEGFGGGVGDGGVGFAVEDDRGRRAFFHVVGGREIFRVGAHALGGHARAEVGDGEAGERGEDERGVKENEGVGDGADFRVVAGAFETGDGGGRRGEVAAGRAAARGDALRVETEARGVGAEPADGGLGVGHAVDGFCFLPGQDAVVGGDRNHSPGGEGTAVLFELGG